MDPNCSRVFSVAAVYDRRTILGCGARLPRERAARFGIAFSFLLAGTCFGQADPAAEPSVLAVAKALPAVVNINTERVVRRTVRDPFEEEQEEEQENGFTRHKQLCLWCAAMLRA